MEAKIVSKIIENVEQVLEDGFGEVKIVIKNGCVHRILKTSEEMMEPLSNPRSSQRVKVA